MNGHILDEKAAKRIPWIDVAKGIGILAIVWGHVLRTGNFRTYLYAFNVPLFFILMGYTFKGNGALLAFVKKKFRQTMIPYYIWSTLSILIFILMVRVVSLDTSEASTSLVKNVLGMLYANSRTIYMKWNLPLWFIPCMNSVLVCVFLIEKMLSKIQTGKNGWRIAVVVIFAVAGLALQSGFNIKLPFQFESGIYMISFVEMGILMKEIRIVEKWGGESVNNLILVMLLFASVMLIKINGFAEIREYNYGKYPVLFFFYSSMLSILMMVLAYRFADCLLLSKIGRMSFPILLMHKFPILLFQTVVPLSKSLLINPDTNMGMICSIIVTIITIIMCGVAIGIIRNFAPWSIGMLK